MSNTFPDGYMVFVESDTPKKWWISKEWQKNEFLKAMKFGTMKTMGYPNPHITSTPFKTEGFNYRFIIKNDWGPVYLENLDTKKTREIKYMELKKSNLSN